MKRHKYSNNEQIYDFLKFLLGLGGGDAGMVFTVTRGAYHLRDSAHFRVIYRILGMIEDLLKRNDDHLGFVIEFRHIYNTVAGNHPRVTIILRPAGDTWAYNELQKALKADITQEVIERLVTIYENEVEVDPERARVLERLRDV